MSEVWKDVPGYEGLYQVSSLGRVLSLDRVVPTVSGKMMHIRQKVLKVRYELNGYQIAVLYNGEKCKTFKVHRLMAFAFIPNPDLLPQINHINGIKSDNRLENLEWCDNSYNQIHAYKTGLKIPKVVTGERHKKSKLSTQDVIDIRSLHESGVQGKDLATRFGVSPSNVSMIVNRKKRVYE